MYSFLQPVQLDPSPTVAALASCTVRAGFPSPAEDWAQERIDLGKLLMPHAACSFLVRSGGLSMQEAGIDEGDLLIVDKYLKAQHGDIVIAIVDNEFTCKRLFSRHGMVRLEAANPTFADIRLKDGQTLEIWGVVTSCIKRFHRY